jgi:hypothetical protein
MTSKAFAVKQIVASPAAKGGSGVVDVAAGYFSKASVARTVYTHAASVAIAASELISSELVNTGAGGGVALTLPTAAAAILAFASAGIVLQAGDTFTVLVTAIPQSITLTASASITALCGGAVVVGAGRSALVTFVVLSAVAIVFSADISNA